MGYLRTFKNMFGLGAKRPPASTFEPVGQPRPVSFPPTGEATFELDVPPLPQPRTEEEEQQSVQEMLEAEGYASAEAAFLSGQPQYRISSNVSYFQYLFVFPDGQPQNELVVGFLDSSAYIYS